MFSGPEERIERKIKRLNAIRAEYEDRIDDLKKMLREEKISKEKYERLVFLAQEKVDKLVSQVKELRMRREKLG
ncbi:MAG: hypothetical protein QXP70_00325 [Methanomassiliicoccales archaeon]